MYKWIDGNEDVSIEYEQPIPVWVKYGYLDSYTIELAFCICIECEDEDFLEFYTYNGFGRHVLSRNLVLQYAIIEKPDI